MSTNARTVELVDDEIVHNIARTALFATLIGAFAYVSFPTPFSPAPVTLQVLGVFLAGVLLGPLWGSAALILYLIAGAVGLPIFASGTGGIGVLVGQQAGYLLGFPIATFVIGLTVHGGFTVRNPGDISLPRIIAALVLGVIIIYTLGVLVMSAVLDLSLSRAIIVGAAVFIPAELVKMIGAIAIVRSDQLAVA